MKELEQRLVEAEAAHRQLRAKLLAAGPEGTAAALSMERVQQLEARESHLQQELCDAVLELGTKQFQIAATAAVAAEYCAIAAEQHTELGQWHQRWWSSRHSVIIAPRHCAVLAGACTVIALVPFTLLLCVSAPTGLQRHEARSLSLKGLERPLEWPSGRSQSARVVSQFGLASEALLLSSSGRGRSVTHTQERLQEHIRRSRYHDVEFQRLYSKFDTSNLPGPPRGPLG
eukprot:GGOE01037553.1.p1 GENE.GGOE01037553.1~~GGOE01037553.1.p1  ORF type:complete len:242 (-),score=56.61 GGOE01037553.1:208-897(-)